MKYQFNLCVSKSYNYFFNDIFYFSAGHCVWDIKLNVMVSADILAVALGKVYSNWQIQDPLEQRYSVRFFLFIY